MQYITGKQRLSWLIRLILFMLAIYFFLVGIELFGDSIELLGKEKAEGLFNNLSNPFAALAVGILATVMVQSSSATTSAVVAAVSTGALDLNTAVPIVMGANVGTTITGTLVAFAHITKGVEFRRAFAGATIHDIFNLMCVLIFLPLQLMTGFFTKAAEFLVKPLMGTSVEFHSPIKAIVKYPSGWIQSVFQDGFHLSGFWLSFILFVIALAIVIVALIQVTQNMKKLMAERIEEWMNRVLKKSGVLGLVIGAGVTALVQSSSITTSLLVPMFGAGVLTVEAGFPILLGANIGTTITAILAAMIGSPQGLAIALVHLLFNLCGVLVFFPFRPIRLIPLKLADRLAGACVKNRIWVFVYILGVFVAMPLLGIMIWK
jgi:solute carrier family 34 (sodium-dependent phosphate cotransporter)